MTRVGVRPLSLHHDIGWLWILHSRRPDPAGGRQTRRRRARDHDPGKEVLRQRGRQAQVAHLVVAALEGDRCGLGQQPLDDQAVLDGPVVAFIEFVNMLPQLRHRHEIHRAGLLRGAGEAITRLAMPAGREYLIKSIE